MRKQKVYLETTLFNFYVDKERGDAHTDTKTFFDEIAGGKYEAYASDYVTDELGRAPAEKRDKMISLFS